MLKHLSLLIVGLIASCGTQSDSGSSTQAEDREFATFRANMWESTVGNVGINVDNILKLTFLANERKDISVDSVEARFISDVRLLLPELKGEYSPDQKRTVDIPFRIELDHLVVKSETLTLGRGAGKVVVLGQENWTRQKTDAKLKYSCTGSIMGHEISFKYNNSGPASDPIRTTLKDGVFAVTWLQRNSDAGKLELVTYFDINGETLYTIHPAFQLGGTLNMQAASLGLPEGKIGENQTIDMECKI